VGSFDRHQDTGDSIYTPFEQFLVRIPLMPMEFYKDLTISGMQRQKRRESKYKTIEEMLKNDKLIRSAIYIASKKILEKFDSDYDKGSGDKKTVYKLMRYLIRMSTRTTPFGIFSSVSMGSWSDETSIRFSKNDRYIKARVDSEWLLKLVSLLESDPFVIKSLSLFTNQSINKYGNRISLMEYVPLTDNIINKEISINATEPVMDILKLSKKGISYKSLIKKMSKKYSTHKYEIEALITNLIGQTILFTNLRFDLTNKDSLKQIALQLSDKNFGLRLKQISTEIKKLNTIELEDIEANYNDISNQMDKLVNSELKRPIEIDMGLNLQQNHLQKSIGEEISKAAEILLSMSRFPTGSGYLQIYKKRFLEKYGGERLVPILDLLDGSKGLGDPYNDKYLKEYVDANRTDLRDDTLLKLPYLALKENNLVITLDKNIIGMLKTSKSNENIMPKSLDIFASVCSKSEKAINSGNFKIAITPITGKIGAGECITRFSYLLDKSSDALFKDILAYGGIVNKDILMAEYITIPKNIHMTNVMIHEPLYEYKVPLGVSSKPVNKNIPLDELYAGVKNNKFYIYWPKGRKQVIIKSNSMINYILLPTTIRFLVEVSEDGSPLFHQFDWGSASKLPFLPRIEYRKIILSPAKWNISLFLSRTEFAMDTEETFFVSLRKWRDKWLVPRYVYLKLLDNRLLLDLDSKEHSRQIYSEIKNLKDNITLEIEEVVPTLDQTWLIGDDGHYFSEFIIPLKLKNPKPEVSTLPKISLGDEKRIERERVNPPFSEWLFLKLYVDKNSEVDLISGRISEFCSVYMERGIIDNWFFIRYSDPEDHIRLRFNGSPKTLNSVLLPEICKWAKKMVDENICFRFVIDTYERETERYGGATGIHLSEKLFGIDSSISSLIMQLLKKRNVENDNYVIAALTADYLLSGLGLNLDKRLALYRIWSKDTKRKFDKSFDDRLILLHKLMKDEQQFDIGDIPIKNLKDLLDKELNPIKLGLNGLLKKNKLSVPIEEIYRSYIHMHFNRNLGVDIDGELLSIVLLKRASEILLYKDKH
jgi:thiopeptide-type bacteriocin biosynthesis protein